MGWLDAFTGAAAKNASNAAVQGLREANEAYEWGGQSAREMMGKAIPVIQSGYGDAMNAIRGAYGEARPLAQAATAAWNPMIEYGQRGVNAYMDAAGLGGAEGNARARESFQEGPGYEWQMEQGTDALARTANARGMRTSGNTALDTLKYGQGLANQEWGSYVSRLNPIVNMYGAGISGRVAGLGNEASLATNAGTAQANTYTGQANAIAPIFGQMGQTYMTEAQNRARTLAEIGQQQAGGIMGAANAQGQTINAGLGLVGKLFGGFMK